MALIDDLRTRGWTTITGSFLFVGMMAIGYFYNLTFVQLGLVDLGTRLIGMSEAAVAAFLALFALITSLVGIAFGLVMTRHGWSRRFAIKLRLTLGVVAIETLLTALAPHLRSPSSFLIWIVAAGCGMGIGIPATFSLTVDLVPVRDRGYAAAAITASAYFFAAVLSSTWRVERFANQLLGLMFVGTMSLAILVFGRFTWIEELSQQHQRPEFGLGRLAAGPRLFSRRMILVLASMFGIYFIDSLGFLRIVNTPILMANTWHSSDHTVLVIIGATHVVTALIGGILYRALNVRTLFLWIFGIFALVQLMYVLHARLTPTSGATLAMAILYSTAVSLYTVVTFALWADLATPDTVAWYAALGVAFSGWTATFLSTALALHWRVSGMSLDRHLSLVAATSLLFFGAMLVLILVGFWTHPPTSSSADQSHAPSTTGDDS